MNKAPNHALQRKGLRLLLAVSKHPRGIVLRIVALIALVSILLPSCATQRAPTHTKNQILQLAGKAARDHGYNLNRYQAPEVHYQFVERDHTWSVFYEGKPDKDGNILLGNHFAVYIHDDTGAVQVFAGH